MNNLVDPAIQYFTNESICPYFSQRESLSLIVSPPVDIAPFMYSELLSLGFRRSGSFFYKAQCPSCCECVPIRIELSKFIFNKKFRRIIAKNSDIEIVILDKPKVTDEKIKMYKKYLSIKHGNNDNEEVRFILEDLHYCYDEVIEFNYFIDKILIGVGIVDKSIKSISSNYFYYDPDYLKRSPGVFSILKEIEYGQKNNLDFYYLGYWLENCSKMNYKTSYKPYQLYINESWMDFND